MDILCGAYNEYIIFSRNSIQTFDSLDRNITFVMRTGKKLKKRNMTG